MNKIKSPLMNWLEENRWSLKAVSEATGLHAQTVHLHIYGKSFPREPAIAAYKKFGVPQDVITDHIRYMVAKA